MGSRLARLLGELPTFAAGATVGAAFTWLLTRSRPGDAAGSRASARERRARLKDAIEGNGPLAKRKLREGESSVDLEHLRRVLQGVPGSEQVHLRDLGGGIVEALGAAPDPQVVHAVLAALRGAPGVTVVVNRIWTPASARERKPDLSHIPRVRRDTSVN